MLAQDASGLKLSAPKADNDFETEHREASMGELILILLHIVCVTALYMTAYRTGYKAGRDESRRRAEAYAAPLTEMLERLNLDIDNFLDDKKDREG